MIIRNGTRYASVQDELVTLVEDGDASAYLDPVFGGTLVAADRHLTEKGPLHVVTIVDPESFDRYAKGEEGKFGVIRTQFLHFEQALTGTTEWYRERRIEDGWLVSKNSKTIQVRILGMELERTMPSEMRTRVEPGFETETGWFRTTKIFDENGITWTIEESGGVREEYSDPTSVEDIDLMIRTREDLLGPSSYQEISFAYPVEHPFGLVSTTIRY